MNMAERHDDSLCSHYVGQTNVVMVLTVILYSELIKHCVKNMKWAVITVERSNSWEVTLKMLAFSPTSDRLDTTCLLDFPPFLNSREECHHVNKQ